MSVRIRLALAALCLAVVACGDNPPDETIPQGHERVNGSERLGWAQQASNAQELATFGYLVHVDENPGVDMQGVTCASSAGPVGFPCSGRLPSMSAGPHALRISAYVDSGGTRLESPRSDPVNVFMVASAATAPSTLTRSTGPIAITAADGLQLSAEVVADGFQEPTDLAFAPDGAILVTERVGRVRVVRAGRLLPAPAVTLPDATTSGGGGLLALAVDPQFERNRFVYLIYTTERGFRLARFRAVGDTLGDRAVLLDGIPASRVEPAALLRFGPDAQLYLGLDDAGDPRSSGDLGSFSGKVLRLNTDGTTPNDQAGASPIYAPNVSAPRGAAWDAAGATLWLLDGFANGTGQLHVIVAAVDNERRQMRGNTIARYALPDKAAGSSLAFYRGDLIAALLGHLLVAQDGAVGEAGILRLVFDAASPRTVVSTERWLRGSIDGARAIAVSPEGIIYLCTRDALVALGPPHSP